MTHSIEGQGPELRAYLSELASILLPIFAPAIPFAVGALIGLIGGQ